MRICSVSRTVAQKTLRIPAYRSYALLLLFVVLGVNTHSVHSQQRAIDSLQLILDTKNHDTVRCQVLNTLSATYIYSAPDSARMYANEALRLAEKIGYRYGIAKAANNLGIFYAIRSEYPSALEHFLRSQQLHREEGNLEKEGQALTNLALLKSKIGDLPGALELYQRSLEIDRSLKDSAGLARGYNNIARILNKQGKHRKALEYNFQSLAFGRESANVQETAGTYNSIGLTYEYLEKPDSAMLYYQQGLELAQEVGDKYWTPNLLHNIGLLYAGKEDYDTALEYYERSFQYFEEYGDRQRMATSLLNSGSIHRERGDISKALRHGRRALSLSAESGAAFERRDAYEFLAFTFAEIARHDSAFHYHKEFAALDDSLIGEQRQQQLNELEARFEAQEREHTIAVLEKEKQLDEAALARADLERNVMIVGVVVLGLIAFGLFRRYQYKKRTSAEIQAAYDKLKRTQAQLIHAEKMATLGEWTAGVAHEIQNPLNFVNNFARLNGNISDELDEYVKSSGEDAVDLLTMLKENTQKIREHGARADAIVKGMLEHSNAAQGKRGLADINGLVRESVDMFKQKEQDAGITWNLELDENIGSIEVLPAELSRAMLNVIDNAVYAVKERAGQGEANYAPAINLSVQHSGDDVRISMRDNGTGMSEEVQKKAFQPFFTTKPTGKGNPGLGLALCWDIITNGHNGSIELQSTEGNGTACTITLPRQVESNDERAV